MPTDALQRCRMEQQITIIATCLALDKAPTSSAALVPASPSYARMSNDRRHHFKQKNQLSSWYNIRGISWRSSSTLLVSSIVPYAPKMSNTVSNKMAFLLFGDQSLDTHEFLADICHRSNLSVLSRSFLEQVGSALREKVDQLPSVERQRVPKFSSIQELNKGYHMGDMKNSALDSALLCITQLAHYIE